ncbi:MAG: DUF2812 domain-containing protein [Oscillospiraceae bacterium]|nr:DUF2812 domain-containing protein [Oscillospiraceae bacterium]
MFEKPPKSEKNKAVDVRRAHTEPRNITRLSFGKSCDLPLYEAWFSDMAANGRHLVSWGTYFCKFAERNPKNVRYRIELREKNEHKKRPRHEDWDFVCKHDDAYVYRTDKDTDFFVNPRHICASVISHKKNLVAFAFLMLALCLLVVILGLNNFSWLSFVTGGYGYFIAALIFAIAAVVLICDSVYFSKIAEYYKTTDKYIIDSAAKIGARAYTGTAPNWPAQRKKSYITAGVFAAMFLAVFLPLAFQSQRVDSLPSNPNETRAPLVWLEDLDTGLQRAAAQAATRYDTNNFIARKWSFLAARQFTARQIGRSADGSYNPTITSQSLACLFEGLAQRIFDNAALPQEGFTLEVFHNKDSEQLWVYASEFGQLRLIARKGKTVLTVEYVGKAAAADLADAARMVMGLS